MKDYKLEKILPDDGGCACIICGSEMHDYFTKNFEGYFESPFPEGFQCDYKQCEDCGFVISDTHRKMTPSQWAALNKTWHAFHEANLSGSVNQPPYLNQALILHILQNKKIISLDSTLDYAAGVGTLAKILENYFHHNISIYDEYITSDNVERYTSISAQSKYKLVINSAMFEHVVDRESLEKLNDLVDDDGVLMLHTLVASKVPNDPNWFYLEPHVHSAFHTNKSMDILMKQWGYVCSIYAYEARCWFWFKANNPRIASLKKDVEMLNAEMQREVLFFKDGFMDYWQ